MRAHAPCSASAPLFEAHTSGLGDWVLGVAGSRPVCSAHIWLSLGPSQRWESCRRESCGAVTRKKRGRLPIRGWKPLVACGLTPTLGLRSSGDYDFFSKVGQLLSVLAPSAKNAGAPCWHDAFASRARVGSTQWNPRSASGKFTIRRRIACDRTRVRVPYHPYGEGQGQEP